MGEVVQARTPEQRKNPLQLEQARASKSKQEQARARSFQKLSNYYFTIASFTLNYHTFPYLFILLYHPSHISNQSVPSTHNSTHLHVIPYKYPSLRLHVSESPSVRVLCCSFRPAPYSIVVLRSPQPILTICLSLPQVEGGYSLFTIYFMLFVSFSLLFINCFF